MGMVEMKNFRPRSRRCGHVRSDAYIYRAGCREIHANKQRPVFCREIVGGTIQQLPQQYEAADAHLHIDKDTPPILFQYGGAEDRVKFNPRLKS